MVKILSTIVVIIKVTCLIAVMYCQLRFSTTSKDI